MKKIIENHSFKDDVAIYFEDLERKKVLLKWNEDQDFYPASFIKLFLSLMAKETILDSPAPEPQVKEKVLDAIDKSLKVSDNDALSYLVDVTTQTASGPELNEQGLKEFQEKRNEITKFFQNKKYSKNISLSNKCFSFGAYGKDAQLAARVKNFCNVEDIAKIMKEIMTSSSERNDICKFMQRTPSTIGLEHIVQDSDEDDYQSKFIGAGLSIAKLNGQQTEPFFSKAAWTSKVRHDAAIIADKYLLVIMTRANSHKTDLIPQLAKELLEGTIEN